MADRNIVVRLKAEVAGFKANMASARKSLDDLTKADIKKPSEAFEGFANKAAIAGGAIALGVGKAIKSFADFDSTMSAVQVATGQAGAQLDSLREAALRAGKDTQFSATEAAQGINELAKAGVGAADILGGGLDGALALAAAGQVDVAFAAESTASALNQFGLEGEQAGHVADLLANAANAAQGGVGDMSAALGQAGVAANAAGLDIDETTTLLALFAKAGMTGSDAGTSLKTMMQRLSAPTADAAQAMADLGVSAYDAQGNFVGAESLIQQLSSATSTLSTEQRMAAFNTIFGADAIRAASIAAEAGVQGYQKMNAEVTKAGGAADTAAGYMDNLKGDIEFLSGSIETVFIEAGSGANDALRGLVQGLTGFVDALGKIPGPILLAGAGLASLALLVPKGVLMWRQYAKNLDSLGVSMDKIRTKSPRTAKALGMVGKAAGLLGVAATAVYAFEGAVDSLNADKLSADLVGTADGLGLINNELAATTSNGWGRVGSDIDSFGKILGATFDPGVINNIDNAIGGFKSIFGGENVSNIANASKQLQGIDQALAQMVTSGNGQQAKATFDQMAKVAKAQGISVEDLMRKLPQYGAAVAQAGNDAKSAATDTGLMTTETDELQQAAEDAEQALSDLQDAILGLGSPLVRQRQATRDYEDAIDSAAEGLKAYKDSLVEQRLEALGITDATDAQRKAAEKWATAQMKSKDLLDTSTEAGRLNQANLDALQQATLDKVAADFAAVEATKGVDAATKVATETMKKGRDAFIKAATAAGMTKDEANKLADQLGLIPENVKILVKQTGAQAAEQEIDRAARNRTATITVNTKQGTTYRYTTGTGANRPAFGGGFFGENYATGGYTGNISPKAVAGLVHGDEHVIKATSRRAIESTHPGLLDYINRHGNLPRGYATGGRVGAALPMSSVAPVVRVEAGGTGPTGNTFNLNGPDPAAVAQLVIDRMNWMVAGG